MRRPCDLALPTLLAPKQRFAKRLEQSRTVRRVRCLAARIPRADTGKLSQQGPGDHDDREYRKESQLERRIENLFRALDQKKERRPAQCVQRSGGAKQNGAKSSESKHQRRA